MTLESDPELDEPTLTHPNLYRSQVLDYILNRRFGDIMLDYRGMVRVEESGSYLSPVGKGQLFFSGTQLFYDGEFLADRASGYGRYFYANGNVLYAGEVLDDKWFGEGTQYHILGYKIYEGSFMEMKYNGQGKLYHECSSQPLYVGSF